MAGVANGVLDLVNNTLKCIVMYSGRKLSLNIQFHKQHVIQWEDLHA